MIIGALGTSTTYWLTRGRYENFWVGRLKTAFALFFWYAFIVYWIAQRSWSASKDAKAEETKKRILG
jgi:hypothetical protein